MWAVEILDNCLGFAGARGENSVGSLSRSPLEISLLGTDRISAADREELVAKSDVVASTERRTGRISSRHDS